MPQRGEPSDSFSTVPYEFLSDAQGVRNDVIQQFIFHLINGIPLLLGMK